MQRIVTSLGLLVLLGLAAAFVWAIANAEAAVVTAATAIIVLAAGEFFTRRRTAQQYRWDKIAPDYEAFITMVRTATEDRDPEELAEQQKEVIGRFNDHLMLWGSPKVIEAWTGAMRLAQNEPDDPREMVLAYARVLLAIRKDLGHGDFTLEARDLLRVTITDIDKHLPEGGVPKN